MSNGLLRNTVRPAMSSIQIRYGYLDIISKNGVLHIYLCVSTIILCYFCLFASRILCNVPQFRAVDVRKSELKLGIQISRRIECIVDLSKGYTL